MADYITKIRTVDGDKQIDYNALANLPNLEGLYAPIGYGLGEYVSNNTLLTDANTATLSGRYYINKDTTNGVGASATLNVDGYGSKYVTQTAIIASTGDTMQRHCINSEWGEWKSLEDEMLAKGTQNGDFNERTSNGVYWMQLHLCTNGPIDSGFGNLIVHRAMASSVEQVFIKYDSGEIWVRSNTNGWGAWKQVDAAGTLSVARGGTGQTSGAAALKAFLADGNTILSSNQYGESLPSAGNKGRIFFKKVSS